MSNDFSHWIMFQVMKSVLLFLDVVRGCYEAATHLSLDKTNIMISNSYR